MPQYIPSIVPITHQKSSLSKLQGFVEAGASGEFVVYDDNIELCVFLQEGAIAWAVRSDMKCIFGLRLIATTGLKKQALGELFRECQRTKLPLGETLIERQLATSAQVRDALRYQVQSALSELHKYSATSSRFLHQETAYASYDTSLTFDLSEVLDEGCLPISSPTDYATDDPSQFVCALSSVVPSASWTCLASSQGAVSSGSRDGEASVALIAGVSRAIGADFTSLQWSSGGIFGFELKDLVGESLWCGFDSESDIVAGLCALNSSVGHMLLAGVHSSRVPEQAIARSSENSPTLERIEDTVSQVKSLAAVLVVDGDETTFMHRSESDLSLLESLAISGASLLDSSLASSFSPSGKCNLTIGVSLILGHSDRWILGTLLAEPNRMLWISVDRATPRAVASILLSAIKSCLILLS